MNLLDKMLTKAIKDRSIISIFFKKGEEQDNNSYLEGIPLSFDKDWIKLQYFDNSDLDHKTNTTIVAKRVIIDCQISEDNEPWQERLHFSREIKQKVSTHKPASKLVSSIKNFFNLLAPD